MPTSKLIELIARYRELGIDSQIDYQKFYLYSIITHSTAIEGSTVTEIENQLLFDKGITAKGRTLEEQMMNLDLKKAYERSIELAKFHDVVSVNMLKELSSLVMKNTGSTYRTALGSFSTANGDLRLLNVTAGIGGRSYMSFTKVPSRLEDFCNKLNAARHSLNKTNLDEIYDLSFEAHYGLVTIHPWADGNGRMARLLMNQIQFEYGVIPSKVQKEDKEGYIKSLAQAQESEDSRIFKSFMYENLCQNLQKEIDTFLKSTEMGGEKSKMGGENVKTGGENTKQGAKSRDNIIRLIRQNPNITMSEIASSVGISAKAVEKQIARLKKDGVLVRIGPDKGGSWEIVD